MSVIFFTALVVVVTLQAILIHIHLNYLEKELKKQKEDK